MTETAESKPVRGLEALQALLASASAVLGVIAGDPVVGRVLAVFARMPPSDREVILRVLEREVHMRLLGPGYGESATGKSLVANPSARLYLRVVDGDEKPTVFQQDELVASLLRAARLLRDLDRPLPRYWCDGVDEAVDLMEPETREALRLHCERVFAALRRVGHEVPPDTTAGE